MVLASLQNSDGALIFHTSGISTNIMAEGIVCNIGGVELAPNFYDLTKSEDENTETIGWTTSMSSLSFTDDDAKTNYRTPSKEDVNVNTPLSYKIDYHMSTPFELLKSIMDLSSESNEDDEEDEEKEEDEASKANSMKDQHLSPIISDIDPSDNINKYQVRLVEDCSFADDERSVDESFSKQSSYVHLLASEMSDDDESTTHSKESFVQEDRNVQYDEGRNDAPTGNEHVHNMEKDKDSSRDDAPPEPAEDEVDTENTYEEGNTAQTQVVNQATNVISNQVLSYLVDQTAKLHTHNRLLETKLLIKDNHAMVAFKEKHNASFKALHRQLAMLKEKERKVLNEKFALQAKLVCVEKDKAYVEAQLIVLEDKHYSPLAVDVNNQVANDMLANMLGWMLCLLWALSLSIY